MRAFVGGTATGLLLVAGVFAFDGLKHVNGHRKNNLPANREGVMSIYGSLQAPNDSEHEDGCSVYVETEPGLLEFSGLPCNCGQPSAPLIYQGSHILPAPDDERGGWVDLAFIPSHITRNGLDDQPEDEAPWPYLRFGVNEGKVVLERHHVEQIRDELTDWLDETANFVPETTRERPA